MTTRGSRLSWWGKTGAWGALLLSLLIGCSNPSPAEARAAYDEGQEALRGKNYSAAVAAFERAATLDPDNTETLLKLGIARSAAQDGPGAMEAYDELLRLDPDHPAALNNTANVYFRQGDHEQAAVYYARAVAARPDYVVALYHYGWVLRQLDRPAEAERLFERCIASPSESPRDQQTQLDCHFYVGALRYRAEDYATAAGIMEEVLSSSPAHPEARYYLGMSYRGLGRLGEALKQLEIHEQLLSAARSRTPISK
jgi:tetratricopeptide (TPR) repeat protein